MELTEQQKNDRFVRLVGGRKKADRLQQLWGMSYPGFGKDKQEIMGWPLSSDEFFREFTISMSNYTSPEHFIDMPYNEYDSKFGAWVYSDSEIGKFSFYFSLYPKNSNINRIALSIMTDEGRVHLSKGWQVVNLSLRKLMRD